MPKPARTCSLLTLACCAGLLGCKDPPTPPKKVPRERTQPAKPKPKPKPKILADGSQVELGNVDNRPCSRTLCIGGPGGLDSLPNRDLDDMCRRARGVVRRCKDNICASVWAPDDWQLALDSMLETLDSNRDSKVDDGDRACPINLAGWSSGAVIVANALPKALTERSQGRHAQVHNLLVIAPYKAGLDELALASNIDKAFIYRNSESPSDDCSLTYEGGPWHSPPVVCGQQTTCYDYDYSRDEGDLAYRSRHGARSGAQIDHCNISSVVAKFGLDNLVRGQEGLREMIPPYIDGTHGGREFKPKPDPIVVLPNDP